MVILIPDECLGAARRGSPFARSAASSPSLIPDLVPALTFRLPETRAKVANAIGQAAQE